MLKEWLLIVWIGTTTNFTLLGYYPSKESCLEAKREIAGNFKKPLVVDCTNDLREGRSQLPSRGHSTGLVK